MRNNTCTICGTEFEPRQGKLYCSNACKQKGFSDRKNKVVETQNKTDEIGATRKQLHYFFQEFVKYKSKYPVSWADSFILYCFIRNSLKNPKDIDEVKAYIDGLGEDFWNAFFDMNSSGVISPAKKKYLEFEAKFFGDDVVIEFSEPVKKSA